MVLSKEHPRVIRYRSAEPVLTPMLPQEHHATIANVVFPTGIDRRDDIGSPDRFDVYYGMADDRIGVARLDLPDSLPPGGDAARQRKGVTPDVRPARAYMKNKTSPTNVGAVVSVRGSVVDVRFEPFAADLLSTARGTEGEIAIEVMAQLDAHRVRGIALTPTQGLARGMPVKDSGGPSRRRSARRSSRECSTYSATPSTANRAVGCPMADHPSRSSAAVRALHEVRDLRDRHQGD